jgi:hypothetical protein
VTFDVCEVNVVCLLDGGIDGDGYCVVIEVVLWDGFVLDNVDIV